MPSTYRQEKRYKQEVAWRQDFDAIIEKYQSDNVTSGTLGCMNYEQVMSGLSGGNNVNLVQPNKSDFIADVEIASRHALRNHRMLWDLFERVYIRQEEEPDLADMDIDSIRMIVGKEFFLRRMSPQHVYQKPRYIDRIKGPK